MLYEVHTDPVSPDDVDLYSGSFVSGPDPVGSYMMLLGPDIVAIESKMVASPPPDNDGSNDPLTSKVVAGFPARNT